MKLVIEIDEEDYKRIQDIPDVFNSLTSRTYSVIRNGTPLPKGHGRLIDADALEGHRQIQIVPCGNGKYTEVTVYYQNDIDVAQTIIEADKEMKE